MFAGKRGDVTFEQIVYAVLAILVLLLLIIIFRKQIGDLFGALGRIVKDAVGLVGEIK